MTDSEFEHKAYVVTGAGRDIDEVLSRHDDHDLTSGVRMPVRS
jgi:hypothetical protein